MNQVIIPHAQASAIKIDGAMIRQDKFGRYCLNDLHMRITAFGLTRITGLVNKQRGGTL